MEQPAPQRLLWPDVAKGVCILLVVLWHVVTKHLLRLDLAAGVPGVWGRAGEALLPLRMPVFFAVSGYLSATVVTRAWTTVLRGRVATLAWVFGVWVLLQSLLLAVAPDFPTSRPSTPAALLGALTVSPTNLWYLPALALFTVAGRAVAGRGSRTRWAVLGVAAALSVLASWSGAPWATALAGNRVDVVQNCVLFLGALLLRGWVDAAVGLRGRRARLLVAGTLVALGLVAALDVLGAPFVWPVVAVPATTAALAAVGAACRRPGAPLVRGLADLGRRTLPLYVLHLPVLAVLDLAVRAAVAAGPDGRAWGSLVALLDPLVVTAATVVVALALHRVFAPRAPWLFERPRFGARVAPGLP